MHVLAPLVLGADPLQNELIVLVLARLAVVGRQLGLPDALCVAVAHLCHEGDLLGLPDVHRAGAHLGDVGADLAVEAGAADADEDAEVDRRPRRVARAAVGALAVLLELEHVEENFAVALLEFFGLLGDGGHYYDKKKFFFS